jgi:predicted nucleic acid-binding protein
MTTISCDTNMLIAAFRSPNGGAISALRYLKNNENIEFVLTDYVEKESADVGGRKPHAKFGDFKKELLEKFNFKIIALGDRIPPPNTPRISDPKDQPIMDIIKANNVDIFITNDEHFLAHAQHIARPEILSLHDFEFKYYAQFCRSQISFMRKHQYELHRKGLGNSGNYMTTPAPPQGEQSDPLHPYTSTMVKTGIKNRPPLPGAAGMYARIYSNFTFHRSI